MQVSVETISSLERKMTIVVPAERIGNEVKERLEKANAASTAATKTTLGDLLKEQMNSDKE